MNRLMVVAVGTFIFSPATAQLTRLTLPIERIPVAGFAMAPAISPDGRFVAFTGENYNSVQVYDFETATTRLVCSHFGSGWGMQWIDERRLLVRATRAMEPAGDGATGLEIVDVLSGEETPLIPFDLANRIEIPRRDADGVFIIQNGEDTYALAAPFTPTSTRRIDRAKLRWVLKDEKIVGEKQQIEAPDGRRILAVTWSPEGMQAMVEVMGSPSLYLFDRLSKTFRLLDENGEQASWLNNNIGIYMVTEDDGHEITKGELYAVSVRNGMKELLTRGFERPAMNPSVSRNGRVAFNTPEGELYFFEVQPMLY